MNQDHDDIAIFYEFAIDLDQRGYVKFVLDEWIKRYPSLGQEFIDFFVDEVRAEELQLEGSHNNIMPSLELVKAKGASKILGLLIQRGNGASKRA